MSGMVASAQEMRANVQGDGVLCQDNVDIALGSTFGAMERATDLCNNYNEKAADDGLSSSVILQRNRLLVLANEDRL